MQTNISTYFFFLIIFFCRRNTSHDMSYSSILIIVLKMINMHLRKNIRYFEKMSKNVECYFNSSLNNNRTFLNLFIFSKFDKNCTCK